MIVSNLAVLMAERGLKIQDVADNTKLSRTTISALFNNGGKGVQFDTMDEICNLLKVTPGELFSYYKVEFNVKKAELFDITENIEELFLDLEHVSEIDCRLNLEVEINIDSEKILTNDEIKLCYKMDSLSNLDSINYWFSDNRKDFFQHKSLAITEFIEAQFIACLEDLAFDYFSDHIKNVISLSTTNMRR